jgi:DNA-binding beta-propeller fold protein YncE
MRTRLALLVALAALAGCAERERINPFDPENGTTLGRPAGFEALAGDQGIRLHWQTTIGEGLLGFQVFRRTSPDSAFRPVTATLPLTTTQYIDFGLLNGLDHEYQLHYVFDRGLGTDPAYDIATPGHRVPWMVDGGTSLLARITADARHVAERRTTLLSPSAVTVDSISHHVWASDPGGGQVGVLDMDIGIFLTIPGFQSPGDIATQPRDSTAWVCDEGSGKVVHLDARGGRRLPAIDGLNTPTGVAIDPVDGTIWVCERNGDHVIRYDEFATRFSTTSVVHPSRVAIDASTHEAWVTSATQQVVHRLDPSGTVVDTYTGFSGPVGIQVDSRRGRIWIADPAANRVTVLDRDGSVVHQIPGLPGARALAVDYESGEAWVALAGSGEIVWLSPAGTVIRRLGGFTLPLGVAIRP